MTEKNAVYVAIERGPFFSAVEGERPGASGRPLLIVKHRALNNDPHRRGLLWIDLPVSTIKTGETPDAVAVREARKGLGIDIRKDDLEVKEVSHLLDFKIRILQAIVGRDARVEMDGKYDGFVWSYPEDSERALTKPRPPGFWPEKTSGDMIGVHYKDSVLVETRRTDGRVLLVKRASYDFMGGLWQYVGETSEAGETPEDTALRGLKQEAGIKLSKHRLKFVRTYNVDDYRINLFSVTVGMNVRVATDEEHDGLIWMSPKAMVEQMFFGVQKYEYGLWPGSSADYTTGMWPAVSNHLGDLGFKETAAWAAQVMNRV